MVCAFPPPPPFRAPAFPFPLLEPLPLFAPLCVGGIHCVAHGHRDGVSFLSGAAARAPNTDRRRTVERFAGAKLRQHLPPERIERSRMTKESRIGIDESVEQ